MTTDDGTRPDGHGARRHGWARALAGAAAGTATAGAAAVLLALLLAASVAVLPFLARPAARTRSAGALGAAVRPLVALERRRLAALFGVEIVGRPGTARSLAYLAARCPVGLFGGLVLAFLPAGLYLAASPLEVLDGNDPGIVPVGLALVYLSAQGTVGLVGTEGWLARRLLGPSRQDLMEERIGVLVATRAGVVTAVDEERRRIERDLHDGVQQRLVLLGMALGRARRDPGSEKGRALVEQAYEETRNALRDLKEVAWRVYPAALAEEGLRAALHGLVGRSALPIDLEYRLSAAPPPAVETAAYFVVAEAVTNAVKHAGARRVDIRVWERDDGGTRSVVVRVRDDGAGGADPSGTGLTGLAGRVEALDGRLSVDSPAGGPTTVTAEVPCG
ncbi:histidine kinase [Nocardiopsis sp. NPDC006198]|uniref:histidine kinase n=1 Tax=Streptomonospora nanhaiensis TaxID=1323731 RepID=A0ABY6YQV2_9ACTN|nr:histidine kinase [Streptomonospora nanhaiensis]WAE74732.1 histidine kinase [Streptomonospora nanhaiensis]